MEEFTKQMAHSSMSVLTKVVRRSCELSQSKSFCRLIHCIRFGKVGKNEEAKPGNPCVWGAGRQ